jgi:hypothetical protein
MKKVSLSQKRSWWMVGISVLLIFLIYKFFTDWRWTVPSNSEVIISLSTTECFGSCAIFEVSMYDNGTVVYEGFAYVGVRGTRKANIGADAVQKLATELENAGYFLLQDSYTQQTYSDSATVYTYVKIGEKEKHIEHYGGDTTAPQELYRLEKLIYETSKATHWINACSFWHPNSCHYNVAFWIWMAMPLILAGAITWSFIKRQRTLVGIVLAEVVVAVIWLFLVQLANSRDLFGILRTSMFYRNLGISEFVAVLPIGLFLVRRYKQNATLRETG